MKRDLVAIVLTLAVAVVSACGSDNSTEPPPAPAPDTVQLQIASVVGTPVFPEGNTGAGGQGDPVGGIGCDNSTPNYHIHSHLSLYVNGEQIAIPPAIGAQDPQIISGFAVAASCWYWLHTHDASGIIHVEPPTEIQTTLGELFDIWGEPLSTTGVAGYEGAVTVMVDGVEYTGDPRAITFEAHKQIALMVGTPLVTPPFYIFPADY